eukprot:jgi/Chrpa1/13049/Chrysochromulina_OHIO_Genome00024578-RA
MGHIYASAIGTTVLQLKELPLRPPEYDGKLCLFDLAPGLDGAAIKAALVAYGDIVSCTPGRCPPATVCFTTHAAAQAAKRAAAQLEHIAGGVDTLFNERSYDGRHGETGLDDDEGRGWCVFESAVSSELILRLSVVPRVKAELDKLPPKMLQLRSGCPLETVDLSAGRLETRVDEVVARIEGATFTGKGDKAMVVGLYKKYVDRIAGALLRVLPKRRASDGATAAPSELPPPVDAPAASPLRLAEGQPLLLLSWQGSGAGGGPRFGVVDATGGRVAAAVTGGEDVELAYDRCSQAVLPWRPPAAGWDAAFVGDARALRDLAEPARRLVDDGRRMESESALRAVGERARAIADGAARCQTIAHAAREAGNAVQSCVDVAAALFSRSDPTPLQAALDKVRTAAERLASHLQPHALEAVIMASLRSSGASGARRYAAGQPLTVRTAGGWRDADVATAGADGLCHRLNFEGPSGEPPVTLALHPWNHAPRELPHAAFEAMRAWWAPWLGAQHAHIADALTGKRLDALQQETQVSGLKLEGGSLTGEAAILDAHSLTAWLLSQHGAQLEGGPAEGPLAALLTAGPASGKTTLLSQVATLALQDERTELVPILVKVQNLQQRLLEAPDAFAVAWNYIDAFLRLEHEASSTALYRMLRQAMMARRALLLLDGLDEAGAKRDDIERHVVEVLAPQGHVLLCTSRPAGVVEARFAAFRRLVLAPLSDAQQERALEQRLGPKRAATLLTYVRDVMPRDDMGQKVTSNPLMLSMVASVYELRQGVGMPATVAELYATASDAMLARGGVATPELTRLLQRIFFEAHVAQRRLIEDRQLDEAALGLEAPEVLAEIRANAAVWEPFGGRAEMGHYVEVTKEVEAYRPYKHKGKRGSITTDDERGWPGYPYKVTFDDGTVSGWLKPDELRSSGLVGGEMAVLQRAMDASAPAVRAACEARLSVALREALRTVRERVLVDALPLLSLLQSEPLQLQSSHLSFQEYFAAIALCDEGTELSGTPPWQWPAWWANAVKLGAEIQGDRFGRGLLRAAGVTGDTLDLSQKLGGGDRPTVRRVLAAMVASAGELMTLNLSKNELNAEDARALAPALTKTTLARVDMRRNKIAGDGAARLSTAVLGNLKIEMFNEIPIKEMRADTFTELDLKEKLVGVEGGMVVAGLIPFMGGLTSMDLSRNQLCGIWTDLRGKQQGTYTAEGITAIAEALRVNVWLTALDLSNNRLEDEGIRAVCKAIQSNKETKLASLNFENNRIGPVGANAVAAMVAVTGALTCVDVSTQGYNIAGDDTAQLAAAILGNLKIEMFNEIPIKEMRANSLTELDLNRKRVGVEGGMVVAGLIPVMGGLTALDLSSNDLKDEGIRAVCKAIQSNKETKLASLNFSDNDIGPVGANAAVVAMVAVTGALTEVHLDGHALPIKKLKGTEPVESLDLSNKALDVASTIVIASLIGVNGSLTSINLSGNHLGGDMPTGIKELAAALGVNGALTSVKLRGNKLRDEGWGAIFAAICGNKDSKIMSLDASSEDIGLAGVKLIAEALRTSVTGALTKLSLAWNKLGEEGTKAICEALKQNKTLKELDLSGKSNNVGEAGAKLVADMLGVNSGLTVTNLLRNYFDAVSAKMLAEVAKQKGISLCGIRRDQTTADFHGKFLEPPDAILLASDLSQAVVTGALTKLSLAQNKLEEEGTKAICEALEQNKTLRELDISGHYGSNIGGSAGSKHMTKMLGVNGALTSVGLRGNELGDEGWGAIFAAICGNEDSKIMSMDARYEKIGPVGVKLIAEALRTSVTGALTSVDLRGKSLGDEGWGAIFAAICGNKDSKIMSMDASSENISPAGVKLIAEALRTSVTGALTKLSLAKNKLGEEGTKAICEALKQNKTIKELDLSGYDNIGRAAGAMHVAGMLGVNGALTSLDLSSNQLCGLDHLGRGTYTAERITAIADALRVNGALTKLSLAWNKLGEEGTKAICEALKQNKTLKELDMSGRDNIGGEAGAKHVADMLGVNGALTKICLADNDLDEQAKQALRNAWRGAPSHLEL